MRGYGNPYHLELVHRSREKSSRSIHIIALYSKVMHQCVIDKQNTMLRETSTIRSSIRL